MRVNKKDTENLKRLPDWVKCMYCGGKPLKTDWLAEVIPNSSALAHQSCLAKRGKIAGLNAGTMQVFGGKIQTTEENS